MRNRTLFICYHAVSPTWRSPLSVTPVTLARQLEALAAQGYTSTGFTDAILGGEQGLRVAITFDDAFLSVYRYALPVLERLGMTATLFAPTDFIGRDEPMSWPGVSHYADSPEANEMLPMSWQQIGELAEAGWEVGSHSRGHPRLSQIADAELERELVESKRECEARLGRECRSIAYPYGDADERVLAAAERAGYLAGCTLMDATVRETSLSQRRIGLHETDGPLSFRIKTLGLTQRLWRSPAWPALGKLAAAIRR